MQLATPLGVGALLKIVRSISRCPSVRLARSCPHFSSCHQTSLTAPATSDFFSYANPQRQTAHFTFKIGQIGVMQKVNIR